MNDEETLPYVIGQFDKRVSNNLFIFEKPRSTDGTVISSKFDG